MRFKALVACAFICSLLSSCVPAGLLDVKELMRAPQLSQEQEDINKALELSLGTRNIILRYPKNGTHLSAFVLYDLNNDGRDEAIVFYSWNSEPEWVNINILENQEDGWISVYDKPGLGAEIAQVDFANVESTQKNNLIIGWESHSGEKELGVYSFEDSVLKTLYPSKYIEFLVSDVTYDGRDDLLVVTPETPTGTRPTTVKLVSYSNREVRSISSAELSPGIASVAQTALGTLRDGTSALFLDYYGPDNLLATHIVTIHQGMLGTPLYNFEEEHDRTEETVRFEEILSQDINGDGYFEIPTQKPLPGYEIDGDNALFLTEFLQFTADGELIVAESAVINKQAGYMVRLREEWIGTVSVVNQMQTHEYLFFEYGSNLEDYTKTLFKVRMFSNKDYQDIFVQETYRKITSRGLFDYYAFIPPPAEGQTFTLTYAELERLFSLI